MPGRCVQLHWSVRWKSGSLMLSSMKSSFSKANYGSSIIWTSINWIVVMRTMFRHGVTQRLCHQYSVIRNLDKLYCTSGIKDKSTLAKYIYLISLLPRQIMFSRSLYNYHSNLGLHQGAPASKTFLMADHTHRPITEKKGCLQSQPRFAAKSL